jgi:dipeptidyl aminopeptidase/acylaminoacyl peptidase
VTGWDPTRDRDKFTPYCPLRNLPADYPPILMIHGTADTDVPFEQSEMMAEQLRLHGVEHRLIAIPGGEHGLVGGEPARIDEAYAAALEIVVRHAA